MYLYLVNVIKINTCRKVKEECRITALTGALSDCVSVLCVKISASVWMPNPLKNH